ncbi:uncharacterized protein LOC126722748 [Quercus robur]|uniref:uncharacterized protein LOC126722748 n=1 Tax=Quercus robur TaxID=38942 RepID=UPI00216176F8|nr:uncharacterized protein LOC126722748 [Quercus robur]
MAHRPILHDVDFSSISVEDASWLDRPFEEEEVLGVINDFNGDKVVFEKSLNASLLALIPKKVDAVEVKDFRPISLFGEFIRLFLSRLKSEVPGVLCKLDVEKAYDHFSILINGSPSDFFGSSKGLRQGDPLSPLLFDIVIEALSRMLDVAASTGQFSGFSVGSTAGPSMMVSHILFADDTLIFCDANPSQIANLRAILTRFEVSGLRINLGKSELVPVGRVYNLETLVGLLGCGQSSLPLKYLGLPLGAKFKDLSVWNPILERMERRLASWKRMYCLKGVGRLGSFNSALRGKWLWRYGMETDVLWRRVIEAKYGNIWGGWCMKKVTNPYGVSLWRYIRSGWLNFSKLLVYDVGVTKGKFWKHVWCRDCTLQEAFSELYCISRSKDSSVAEIMGWSIGRSHWNVQFRRPPQDWEEGTFDRFMGLVYSSTVRGFGPNKVCWKPTRNRGFEVEGYCSSFYPPNLVSFSWRMTWHSKVPPRVAFFSWSASLGKILMTDNLRKRCVIVLDWCYMCKSCGESVDHLLLHCSIA